MSESSLVEISETELIYKGVRFVADPNIPNKVSLYLIKDNHNTLPVRGHTAEEILTHAQALLKDHSDANCGILFLLCGRKEIKRQFFYINDGGVVLNCRDKKLDDLLKEEEVAKLLSTNIPT